ncbi:hypothetical protein [Catellatospora sp. NPDC049133]|uniref:hypothetical protein n=1 Tax=Catellatospora sp. NPDC049133 TaxID=3155499 RepID=UPI0033EBC83E
MTLTLDHLAGYVDRDLDADLAHWYADAPTVRIPAEVRAVEPFLAKLPPLAAAVLSAFDRRGRSGAMPQFLNRSGVEGDFRPLNQPGALEPEAGLPAGL